MFRSLNQSRRGFIGGALMVLSSDAQSSGGEFPSLDGATTWLNSPNLAMPALLGKVVLVNFCTYTCINWLRSLPYVRAWADVYRDSGLAVIGVHSPEFEFEKDVDHVRRAAQDLKVTYPIAVDNEHKVWRAFGNQYWPALYLIDTQGRMRHRQFGEGGYEQTEIVLRHLLSEAGVNRGNAALVSPKAAGVEAAADWANLKSPETYLGYGRTRNFASPGGAARDRRRVYTAPFPLRLNHWALSGDWTIQRNSVLLTKPGGRIAYRFHARDLHLVMGPASREGSSRFRVLLDGKPPGSSQGIDIDREGNGMATWQRLHQLIRQPGAVVDRRFEIEFLDAGAAAFCFTFG